jgi:hypothetical protein
LGEGCGGEGGEEEERAHDEVYCIGCVYGWWTGDNSVSVGGLWARVLVH